MEYTNMQTQEIDSWLSGGEESGELEFLIDLVKLFWYQMLVACNKITELYPFI